MTALPILYSFRRCPYAMRARMGLRVSGTAVRLREVVLRDKPDELIAASPKGTVPVLIRDDGDVIDESLAIMDLALKRADPDGWLDERDCADEWIARADGEFKHHLDRYKYPVRYDDVDPAEHRAAGLAFLTDLDAAIAREGQICGPRAGLADHAIFPFVRQFANHDRDWFDAQPLPALAPWLSAHLAGDLFGSVMRKYPQWRTGDEEPVLAP